MPLMKRTAPPSSCTIISGISGKSVLTLGWTKAPASGLGLVLEPFAALQLDEHGGEAAPQMSDGTTRT